MSREKISKEEKFVREVLTNDTVAGKMDACKKLAELAKGASCQVCGDCDNYVARGVICGVDVVIRVDEYHNSVLLIKDDAHDKTYCHGHAYLAGPTLSEYAAGLLVEGKLSTNPPTDALFVGKKECVKFFLSSGKKFFAVPGECDPEHCVYSTYHGGKCSGKLWGMARAL